MRKTPAWWILALAAGWLGVEPARGQGFVIPDSRDKVSVRVEASHQRVAPGTIELRVGALSESAWIRCPGGVTLVPIMKGRVFLLMMTAVLGMQAEERAEALAAAGVAKFQAAYEAWDGSRFAAAAGLFQQAISHAPNASSYHYWLGVAHFHHLLQLQTQPGASTHTPAARTAMDAALAALRTAVKLDEQDAESHALLGTLYGMRIDGNLIRAARFGPRVQAHRNRATQFGSDNPRVHYLLGICQFHTAKNPAALCDTLASFLTAEEFFAAEAQRAAGPLEPRWGRSSCLTFTGRTYELLGERALAAEVFRRALALHPADHVASEGLARVTDKE